MHSQLWFGADLGVHSIADLGGGVCVGVVGLVAGTLLHTIEQAAQGSPQAKFRLTRLIKSALDDPVSIRAAELLGNPSAGVTAGGTPKL